MDYRFNMYDMILPGDQAEIIAIRDRLNCDLDTAILTIFERRNLLINNFSRGPSRVGHPSVSERFTSLSLGHLFQCVLSTEFTSDDRKAQE